MADENLFRGDERRHTHDERLMRLETELHEVWRWARAMDADLRRIEAGEREEIKRMESCHKQTITMFQELKLELMRYKGMVGGVMLAMGAIGAALVYLKQWVLLKLGFVS